MPNSACKKGFTLIELMIVVSIMALMGIYALVNMGSFRKDADLQSQATDLQNFLRLAQTNATENVKCNGVAGVPWAVQFLSSTHINLICANQSTPFNLHPSITISKISGSSECSFPATVEYAPLYGTISVKLSTFDNCVNVDTKTLSITLSNGSGCKIIAIGKGGSADVQQSCP